VDKSACKTKHHEVFERRSQCFYSLVCNGSLDLRLEEILMQVGASKRFLARPNVQRTLPPFPWKVLCVLYARRRASASGEFASAGIPPLPQNER
jgi:hypothetical protein